MGNLEDFSDYFVNEEEIDACSEDFNDLADLWSESDGRDTESGDDTCSLSGGLGGDAA